MISEITIIVLTCLLIIDFIWLHKFSKENKKLKEDCQSYVKQLEGLKDSLERAEFAEKDLKKIKQELSQRLRDQYEKGYRDAGAKVSYLEDEITKLRNSYRKQLDEQEYKILKKVCYKVEVEE